MQPWKEEREAVGELLAGAGAGRSGSPFTLAGWLLLFRPGAAAQPAEWLPDARPRAGFQRLLRSFSVISHCFPEFLLLFQGPQLNRLAPFQ